MYSTQRHTSLLLGTAYPIMLELNPTGDAFCSLSLALPGTWGGCPLQSLSESWRERERHKTSLMCKTIHQQSPDPAKLIQARLPYSAGLFTWTLGPALWQRPPRAPRAWSQWRERLTDRRWLSEGERKREEGEKIPNFPILLFKDNNTKY